MQRSLLVALTALTLLSMPARAEPNLLVPDPTTVPLAELEHQAPGSHPANLFILAIRLFEEGRRDEAVRWLYIAQIRYRFHLAANPDLPPDGDPALFASFLDVIGQPINEYAGGDVDGWIASMREALDWDARTPNTFTPKSAHAAELEEVRTGLAGLIAQIDADRDAIPLRREENGLENRTR